MNGHTRRSTSQTSAATGANTITGATRATAVRVRISALGTDTVRIELAGPTGEPVATVESLTVRSVDAGRLAAVPVPADLLRLCAANGTHVKEGASGGRVVDRG